jgi:hypothetical protein
MRLVEGTDRFKIIGRANVVSYQHWEDKKAYFQANSSGTGRSCCECSYGHRGHPSSYMLVLNVVSNNRLLRGRKEIYRS